MLDNTIIKLDYLLSIFITICPQFNVYLSTIVTNYNFYVKRSGSVQDLIACFHILLLSSYNI
jgi:hypothetical protein